MSGETWQICQINRVAATVTLQWGLAPCAECLVTWVVQEATKQFVSRGLKIKKQRSGYVRLDEGSPVNNKRAKVSDQTTIKCLNFKWAGFSANHFDEEAGLNSHRLDYTECLWFLQRSEDVKALETFSDRMLQISRSDWRDGRRWPNRGCGYYGFVDTKSPCNMPLECDKCYFHWDDRSLYTFWHRIKSELIAFRGPAVYLEYVKDASTTAACPQWEYKWTKINQGNEQICEHCDTHFCWRCLDTIVNQTHQNVTYWSFNLLLTVCIYLYLFLVPINLHLWYAFEGYKRYFVNILYGLGIFVGANSYVLTILFEFVWLSKYTKYLNRRGWKNITKMFMYWILSYLYIPVWLATVISSFLYCSFIQLFGRLLLIEATIIAVSFLIIGLLVSNKLKLRNVLYIHSVKYWVEIVWEETIQTWIFVVLHTMYLLLWTS